MLARCVVAYDGTGFSGWQRQVSRRTVQGCLEEGLERITGEAVRVTGAGRTDAGVHAVGQVAHFDARWRAGVSDLEQAWNAVLPEDVAVYHVSEAPGGFHARRDAIARTYRYRLQLAGVPCPQARRTSIRAARGTDLARMAEAAGRLIGRYDFGGFGRPMAPDGSTVRTVRRMVVRAQGPWAVVEIEGDAFLRHQVRRMMGLLLDIGRGRYPVTGVDEVLARTPGAPPARSAPARALTLWAVEYPSSDGPWPGSPSAGKGATGEDIYA